MSESPIFHIAVPDEWAAARAGGVYERSTRGRSLSDVGFIHCSFADQVAATANRYYADLDELVVLAIDPLALASPVVVEAVPSGEKFPHVYGPIPVPAVVSATPWRRGPGGTYDASPPPGSVSGDGR